MQGTQKKHKPLKGFITAAILLALWFSGAAGWSLRSLALRFTPEETARFRIVGKGREVVADPPVGAVLLISEPRLRRLAKDYLGWKAVLIPPNFVPRSYAVSGEISVPLEESATQAWFPVVLRIVPGTPTPKISVRAPSDLVNAALSFDGSFANREKQHTYSLGHYKTIHQLIFDTVSMTSVLTEKELKRPITHRRISGYATGKVKLKIKENIGNASITARVRRMDMRCDLDFKKYMDGIAMSYNFTIPKLDADIPNLAPMFEGGPTEEIRQALEESMARPKNLEKLARKRFPLMIPLDTEISLEVFKSPSE